VSSEDPQDRELFIKEAQYELINMEENRLKPDTATMNAFIQALCSMLPARITDALLILRAMKIEDIQPDDYTYSILFTALGKEGYVDEALQLFRNTDRYMDTPALNSLLRAFISGPNPLQAIQIYNEIISQNSMIENGKFLPSKYTFTILYLAISRSICPLKFMSPVEATVGRESNAALKNNQLNDKSKSRRTSTKPLRFLTTFSRNNTDSNSSVDYRGVTVDTTIGSDSINYKAKSVLGEVVKSIGDKLSAQIANSDRFYEIQGIHGNFVRSSYGLGEEIEETETEQPEDDDLTQPLVYDVNSGRFYEQIDEVTSAAIKQGVDITKKRDSNKEGTDQENTIKSNSMKVGSLNVNVDTSNKSKKDYSAEDLLDENSKDFADKFLDIVEPVDRYGPPDNLDNLRKTYYKDLEAKLKKTRIMNEEKIAAQLAILTSNDTESNNGNYYSVDLSELEPDQLLQKLFLSMRYEYNIEADEIMISALNSLFISTNDYRPSDNEDFSGSRPGYKPTTSPSVSLGWRKKNGTHFF
jgi:pentatricopeptide repeat protein